MTAKIFRNSFLAGLLVLLAAAVLFLTVMYSNNEDLAFDKLRTETAVLAPAVEQLGIPYLQSLPAEDRITWVAADGSVLYDDSAQPDAMENHLAREEIAAALRSGEGRATRYSKTGTARAHYYALRLSDGSVLRTACTQDSIAALAGSLLLPVSWIVLLIVVLCAAISFRVARQITRPINSIDLDAPDGARTYPELQPLVARIRDQNRTIRHQLSELSRRQKEFSAITEQMQNEGYEYYYIHRNGGHIGYTAIKNDGKRLFLSKLYIKKEFRGNGYASAVFKILRGMTSERSLRAIWLTVNKYNASSIAVYEKLGFRRIGEGVTDIGNGYVMDDFFYQYDINSVRKIEEDDRDFFLDAADTFYHTDAVEKPLPMKKLEAIFAEMMRSDVYLEGMILMHNGERAGYAAIAKTFQTESAALTVWIEDLYILPEFRGKGIGNTFFERLFERFDSVTGRYRLEVEPENEVAYNLYKKMGFRVLGYTEMIKEMN